MALILRKLAISVLYIEWRRAGNLGKYGEGREDFHSFGEYK
jgi:hypothetical protein